MSQRLLGYAGRSASIGSTVTETSLLPHGRSVALIPDGDPPQSRLAKKRCGRKTALSYFGQLAL
ncbi:hypothetical protein M514_19223 [Trichuris suis]|uniref:Uncharacterized protein n=1 Tax=Trichuris suis TaxID=68888 RepID=A0A085NGJ4_9BILA|nr:hypothetical protein M514_19223 [Trichuris suis]